MYKKSIGKSIYCHRCNITTSQRLFLINLPSFHHLDLSTRPMRKDNKYIGKHKKIKKSLSHSEIINIQKSRSYNDIKSYKKT